jgi:hypothetical protein
MFISLDLSTRTALWGPSGGVVLQPGATFCGSTRGGKKLLEYATRACD